MVDSRYGRVASVSAVLAALLTLSAAVPAAAQGQAAFAPPHSDYGLDTDGDMLFNFLMVDVSISVTVDGFFLVAADLYDITGTTYITGNAVSGFMTTPGGVMTVDLDGISIRSSGFNGPYLLQLLIFDDMFNLDDIGTHTTAAYLATDFDPVPATFAPPHSDAGVDTDGDMLFNYLRVSVVVDTIQAVDVAISGILSDGFNVIDIQYAVASLPSGPGQVVVIDFVGWAIRNNGVDGPYAVDLSLYDPFTGTPYDFDTHFTSAYGFVQFDLPPATLAPPHADVGVDTDADTLFNQIRLDVSVSVAEAGDFAVDASLWDSTFTTFLGGQTTFATLGVGTQTVPLGFSTLPMVAAGINGAYEALITLYDASFNQLDLGGHTTQAYTVGQFDPLPAQFAPPHADMGVDRDVPPDGLFNVLQVDVSVDVTDAGTYVVFGDLYDSTMTTGIASEARIASLTPGVQTVSLTYSGVAIRNSGINGPYLVDLYLATFAGGFPLTLDTGTHMTGPYASTAFQSVTPATLSGTIRDGSTAAPIPFASVSAYDYRNNYIVSGGADGAGFYSLPLALGDWVVVYDDFAYDSSLSRYSLTADTTADVDLFPMSPTVNTFDATLSPWDAVALDLSSVLWTDSASLRLLFDWYYGDRDEMLTQAEFDDALALFGFTPPSGPNSTWDFLRTDGMWYDLVTGSYTFAFVGVPGPIDSAAPISVQETMAFVNATISASPTHLVGGFVTYNNAPYDLNMYDITFPAGYLLTSYNAPAGVTVTGVGTGTATIDPGADPNPLDTIYGVWIELTAVTPDVTDPVVTSAAAVPDPVVIGSTITVTATATDDNGVASVRLQVWDPSSTLVVDTGMNPVGGGAYDYAFSPTVPGTYTFTVTAMDFAGNFDASPGQFDAIELNPPVISATGATPDPVEYGLFVLLFATVTDDWGISNVAAEVRDAGNNFVGNFTMTFNAGAGRYEATQTINELGTISFTIWATDTSGNVASAGGSFVIQDTTDPTLTGAAAAPDPVEVGTAVRISATASDLAGLASVRVEVRDPANAIVGTFTMTLSGTVYEYSFIPTELGAHTFTITATDTSMNTAVASGSFTSQDSANPVANAGADQTVDAGVIVAFDGSGSTDNHGIVTYTWTFTEAGQTRTLTGESPTHAFNTSGTYVVTLRVTDESGNFAEDTVTITVQAAGPGGGGAVGIPSWAWLLVAVVIAAILAALFLIRRKKAQQAAPPTVPTGATTAPPPSPPEAPPPESPGNP